MDAMSEEKPADLDEFTLLCGSFCGYDGTQLFRMADSVVAELKAARKRIAQLECEIDAAQEQLNVMEVNAL